VSVPRILVRAPNWLGDLVMSTPGFRALRAAYPDSHLTLHVREPLLPLLQGSPWFDDVLPLRSYHAGTLAMLSEARALRAAGRFDLGICIPDSWSSLLLMRAAGVREVVGYDRAGRGAFLHRRVPGFADAGPRRLVARERHVLGLMECVGAPARGTELELFTTPDEEARAESALVASGVDPEAGCVALAPGASYGTSKHWPATSFARVADEVVARGLQVVILGAPGEEALAARVAGAMTAKAAVLAGELDLGALKAVVRRMRILVCNDAGARHVAVAFGVPSVVMMGPTSLAKTDWNLERVRVIQTDVDCRPCYARDCPIDHRCMIQLTPDRVTRAVDDWLSAELPGQKPRRQAENAGT